MKKIFIFFLLFCSGFAAYSQTQIHGYVMNADSIAVSFATVRLPGLGTTQTNEEGYFEFIIPPNTANEHFLRGGVDIYIEIKKEGMVMFDPPDGKIRLPYNWSYQNPFTIYLCRKGSLLLIRSDRVLEYILRERINVAVNAKEEEIARRDVLAEQAMRLGLDKDELMTAVEDYKDRARNSINLNKSGLVALDDAINATTDKKKQQKLIEAENNFREALRKDELTIREGREAEARLSDIYYNLGLTFFQKANYDSSLVFFIKADSVKPGNAEINAKLGEILLEMAQYDRALIYVKNAFKIDSTIYGMNHPNTAIRLDHLGEIFRRKGDFSNAIKRYYEAVNIMRVYQVDNRSQLAILLNNWGLLLVAQGDYAGASEKYIESLTILEQLYGRNNWIFVIALNNWGLLLMEKGNYDAALEKFQEALKFDESYWGSTHPKVATRLNNIAAAQKNKGDLNSALENYKKALKIDEAVFGGEHEKIAIRLNNIGNVLFLQKDYSGAMEMFTRALTIVEAISGHNHPMVASRLTNIAGVLREMGEYDKALENYTEALHILEGLFGKQHPRITNILHGMARLLEAKGDYEAALKKYNETIELCEKELSREHPNTKTAIKNRDLLLKKMNEKKLHPRALSAKDSLQLYNGIGVGYTKQSKTDSALLFLLQALPIAERLKEQEMLGTLYNNLGSAHKLKQNWPQARQWLEKSLSHNRALVGDSAAVLAYTYFHLAGVAQAEGRTNLSREYAQKSLALAERHKLAELHAEVEALLKQKDKKKK